MFCQQCGAEQPNGMVFCDQCGSKLMASVQHVQEETVQQTPAVPAAPVDPRPPKVRMMALYRHPLMLVFTLLQLAATVITLGGLIARLADESFVMIYPNGGFDNDTIFWFITTTITAVGMLMILFGSVNVLRGGFSESVAVTGFGLRFIKWGLKVMAIRWILHIAFQAVRCVVRVYLADFADVYLFVAIGVQIVLYALLTRLFWSAANAVDACDENLDCFTEDGACLGQMLCVLGKGTGVTLFVVGALLLCFCVGLMLIGVFAAAVLGYYGIAIQMLSDAGLFVMCMVGGALLVKQFNLFTQIYWEWSQSNK